jgi:hypothetical protein
MTIADLLNGLTNLAQFLIPAALIAWADRAKAAR